MSDAKSLSREEGSISKIATFTGQITLKCGLVAFFNPREKFYVGHSLHQPVSCFLGFRYSGLGAWDVQPMR